MGDLGNIYNAVVKMNPISGTQKACHIIVGAVVNILDDDLLPDNHANNCHRKHHDHKLHSALEHPKHKSANAAQGTQAEPQPPGGTVERFLKFAICNLPSSAAWRGANPQSRQAKLSSATGTPPEMLKVAKRALVGRNTAAVLPPYGTILPMTTCWL